MRLRLFALLLVPLLALVALGAYSVVQVSEEREAAEATARLTRLASRVANIDAALGNETLVAVSSRSQQLAEEDSWKAADLAEFKTDTSLVRLEDLLEPSMSAADQQLQDVVEQIREARQLSATGVARDQEPLALVNQSRTLRANLLRAVVDAAASDTRTSHFDGLLGMISLVEARSAHLDERLTVQVAMRFGQWAPGQLTDASIAIAAQRERIGRATALLGTPPPEENAPLREARHLILNFNGRLPQYSGGVWQALSHDWSEQLDYSIRAAEADLVREVDREAADAIAAQRWTVAGVGTAILVSLGTAAFVGGRLVRRVRRVANAAADLSLEESPLDRLNDGGSDEIAEMADAFDRMSERIQQSSSVRAAESRVLARIAADDPIEETLADCSELLPPGVQFAYERDVVYLIDEQGNRSVLEAAFEQRGVGDDQLAIGLAQMASWRSTNLKTLRHRATFDGLTNLHNRAAGLRALEELCASGQPAVLYLDLDNFKRLNDAHGHEAGDRVLREVAHELRALVAEVDGMAARIGGDEFVVAVADGGDPEMLLALGADLVHRIRKLTGLASAGVSVSVGIAPNSGNQTATQLLHEADAAMYKAKQAGRSQVVVADAQVREELTMLKEIELGLAAALANDEFSVHYQGIWATTSGELVAFEALARWTDGNGVRHSPGAFFAAAERIGCAHDIDEVILQKVCTQIRKWEDQGFDLPPIHVNMSAQSLNQVTIVDRTLEIIANADCRTEAVVVEITESSLLCELDTASSRLDQLRAAGVQIAVDDFGEGYSSLRYLSKLPIDILKIDRQFIDRIDANRNNLAIVRAVTSLANTLGMLVVAEGVERQEEHDVLRELGCGLLQGYLLGRPVPPDVAQAAMRGVAQPAHNARPMR